MNTPRTTPRCIGHVKAEEVFLSLYAQEKLPHAWILAGAKGIGKATLAYRFARILLSGEAEPLAESHPVFRRIVAGSHTDLLVIEPEYDEKKEEAKREISVEEARSIASFLALTPAESPWRVVIVDSADELNVNAANCILKILEEPPPRAVLLLVSHNPGRLLPTIRSRCRMLNIPPTGEEEYRTVMRLQAPDMPPEAVEGVGIMTRHTPGVALDYHARGALEWYGELVKLLSAFPAIDGAKLHTLADKVSAKQLHANWRMFTRLTLLLFERAAQQAADSLAAGERECLARLAAARPPSFWADAWFAAHEEFSLAERLHLDYKATLIGFFESMAGERALKRYA